jgi:beta-lactam-binding protein with PASTA domain
MVIVLVIIVFGTFKGIDYYTHHGEKITVPNLKGIQMADAEYKLSQMGLKAVVVDSGYIRSLAPGCVLEQMPAAGEEVKNGRIIYLTVNSTSTPTLALPDIADNSSYREAVARLQAMGFRVGMPEYVEGEKDWVYGVKCGGRVVSSGQRVPIDVPLVLQVGNGKVGLEEDSINYVDPESTEPDNTDENTEMVGE